MANKEAVKNTGKTETKVAEKAVEKAAEVKDNAAAKVAEIKEAAKEEVQKAPKEAAKKVQKAAKATSRKAAAVKKTVKKTAAKAAAKVAAPGTKMYLQFDANEAELDKIEDKIKAQFIAEGHRAGNIKSLNIYVKPQDGAAYYVINDKFSGRIELF